MTHFPPQSVNTHNSFDFLHIHASRHTPGVGLRPCLIPFAENFPNFSRITYRVKEMSDKETHKHFSPCQLFSPAVRSAFRVSSLYTAFRSGVRAFSSFSQYYRGSFRWNLFIIGNITGFLIIYIYFFSLGRFVSFVGEFLGNISTGPPWNGDV